MDDIEFAAYLVSRVCHDLVGPLGAVVNGLEVMEDERDAAMRADALKIVSSSALQALSRLQFLRIAFGAAGSAGAQIDSGDAEKVARGLMEDDKTKFAWNLPRLLLPKNRVKLLLNMLLIAGQTIPRGGQIKIDPVGEGETMGFKVGTTGLNARVPPAAASLLAGIPAEGHSVDAHAVQPFYTGLLARSCGLAISIAAEGDGIAIAAR